MKRICGLLILIFGVTVAYALTLDSAIENAASEVSGKLPEGSTIVVVSFESDSSKLSDHVIDELNGKIANIGKIKPVERRQLNKIRAELNFNMSDYVSEESAQNVGRMLGAQYIMFGSIDDFIGNQYRMRFRAITTETASIEYSFSQNIIKDKVLESLLQGTGTSANFSSSERWGASALNLFFGLGSFAIQKDRRQLNSTIRNDWIGMYYLCGCTLSSNKTRLSRGISNFDKIL
jgi:TolB-like protein